MATPPGKLIGDEVRELRERYGLAQHEVAAAWGRPQSNLSVIEHNKRAVSAYTEKLIKAAIRRLAEEKRIGDHV